MATKQRTGTGTEIVKVPRLRPARREDAPSFTISADSNFGIRCMIAVRDVARQMLPAPEFGEITAKLREFDLYEEQHRG